MTPGTDKTEYRRRSTDVNGDRDFPLWVRVTLKAGLPVAVSIYLIWLMSATITTGLDAIGTELHDHTSESRYFMRQICINTSKTDSERAACFGFEPKAYPKPEPKSVPIFPLP